jgi:hypothetical protein
MSKRFSDTFPTHNGVKQGNALSSLPFSCIIKYAVREVQVCEDALK